MKNIKMNTVEEAINHLDGLRNGRKPLFIEAVIGDKTYGLGNSDDHFGGIGAAIYDAVKTLRKILDDGHVLESASTKTVKIPSNYNPKGYNSVTKAIFNFSK